jgi:hypothetical protein
MGGAKIILGVMLLAILASAVCRGDLIQLRDGTTISGTMRADDLNVIITADDGTVTEMPRGDVLRVTLDKAISPADTARAEWRRTAAEIQNSADLGAILQLHQKFLAKYAAQPAATEAKLSLEKYQTLVAQHAVKFRSQWMSPDAVAAQQRQWTVEAQAATSDFNASRFDAAFNDASVALKTNPQNPMAETILGLTAYAKNNLNLARQTFTKLSTEDPDNLLALNNLAIVSFDLKSADAALHFYLRALAIKSDNRLLLDDIAYGLNSYANKRDQTFQQLSARFRKADAAMQLVMGADGLFRVGSTWVDQKTLTTLQANLQSIQNALNAADAQYQSDTNQYNTLQAAIVDAESNYNQAVADDDPNADYYQNQWADLSKQSSDLNASIQQDETDTANLRTKLTKEQQIAYPPPRLMNPGEEINPLPPARVYVPGS